MARMHVGMMWFDSDRDRPLPQRIRRAVDYYQSKYGGRPNVLFLHPETRGDEELDSGLHVKVETSTSVLPDHFWLGIGVEEAAVAQ